MKSVWPGRISGHSCGSGSLTFTIRSARAKISAGVATSSAPSAAYSASGMPEPTPAPRFDQHVVPGARQLLDADRQHGHAVFVAFDFLRHADEHGGLLMPSMVSDRLDECSVLEYAVRLQPIDRICVAHSSRRLFQSIAVVRTRSSIYRLASASLSSLGADFVALVVSAPSLQVELDRHFAEVQLVAEHAQQVALIRAGETPWARCRTARASAAARRPAWRSKSSAARF